MGRDFVLVVAARVHTKKVVEQMNNSKIEFPPPNISQVLCGGRIPSMIIQTESVVKQINMAGVCLDYCSN